MQNGLKQWEMVEYCWKWPKVTKNYKKLPKVTKVTKSEKKWKKQQKVSKSEQKWAKELQKSAKVCKSDPK